MKATCWINFMGRRGLEWGRNKMTNKNALLGSSKNSNGGFFKI